MRGRRPVKRGVVNGGGGRAVALGALVLGAVALAWSLANARHSYVVWAHFQNASQLVHGARVEIGGEPVGSVGAIRLDSRWEAAVELKLSGDGPRLRQGTKAIIRQPSLSSVAGRYVDLQIPPATSTAKIPDGGIIATTRTGSTVDIDQIFQLLRPRERSGLRQVVRGFAAQFAGRSTDAAKAFRYLDPTLLANATLFGELDRSRPALERFVVESAAVSSSLAQRRDDLTGLVDRLAALTGAIAHRRDSLGRALDLLPPFLRRATTTFADLRRTLDDLDPVVKASRPVARRLGPVLAQLRPFAHEARPTLADLAQALDRPGPGNDLVELTASNVGLSKILVGPVQRNGKKRQGALPETTDALAGEIGGVANLRPYTPDLLGWFDDFAHTGLYDANGNASRSSLNTNAFALIDGQLTPVPPALRGRLFDATAARGQNNRCPGGGEHRASDGSAPYLPDPDSQCKPDQALPGG